MIRSLISENYETIESTCDYLFSLAPVSFVAAGHNSHRNKAFFLSFLSLLPSRRFQFPIFDYFFYFSKKSSLCSKRLGGTVINVKNDVF